jgi:hypothetical protein
MRTDLLLVLITRLGGMVLQALPDVNLTLFNTLSY